MKENIAKELVLIEKLNYAPYFLTVHDIVQFARTQDPPILCQGRGSAANSTVCYVIGITAVDPNQIELLFERFISEERKEPPDIDVDFEHERREQVIQYIYARYGRERAGLAATVITYRGRSAMREVGKVMGLSEDVTATLAGIVWGQMREEMHNGRLQEAGLDPDDPLLAKVIELADDIQGFPRHLSQHVGGFVLTKGRLDETVPIGNAAMEDRTFIEWDKDDIDTLGILKIDVLALGMLTCIQKSFEMMEGWYGLKYSLATPAARGQGRLRHAVQGGFGGRLPGREPGADEHAAAAEAALLLRSRHRGGDRAARPDPGRHGASLPEAARRAGARGLSGTASGFRPAG